MRLTPWQILLIPAVIVFLAGIFITINRYFAYKERVELARLGFSLEDLDRQTAQMHHGNRGVLWGGVITTASGLALLLGLSTLGSGVWLLGGLLPLFVGLGMILIYLMTRGPAGQPDASDGEETDGERAAQAAESEPISGNGSREPEDASHGTRSDAPSSSAITEHLPN